MFSSSIEWRSRRQIDLEEHELRIPRLPAVARDERRCGGRVLWLKVVWIGPLSSAEFVDESRLVRKADSEGGAS